MKLGPEQIGTDADENRNLPDYHGRTRHLRIFSNSGKIKSALNFIRDHGERPNP